MVGEIETVMARQREAMAPRLYPDMPPHKYLCFYPMDRKRGELKNWYRLPMAERQRQMHEHGMVGRRYAGEVKQIISRIDRLRRLGVGRRPVCRRSAGVQEAHLRNALRRSQCRLCAVRHVLPRNSLPGAGTCRLVEPGRLTNRGQRTALRSAAAPAVSPVALRAAARL